MSIREDMGRAAECKTETVLEIAKRTGIPIWRVRLHEMAHAAVRDNQIACDLPINAELLTSDDSTDER